jgi:hypothetical protein
VRHPDRRNPPSRRPLLENLEPRQLLTAFVNTDIAATWGYYSLSTGGSVSFDAANTITGISVTPRTGVPVTPTGTYAHSSTGALALNSFQIPGTSPLLPGDITPYNYSGGAIDVSKDVFAATTVGIPDSLALAAKPAATPYVNKDISGSWNIFFNADTSTATGFGKINFGAKGKISSGNWTTGSGKNTVISGGTYSLSADGSVAITIAYKDPSLVEKNLSFTAQINASKDIITAGAANLPAAVAAGDSLAATLVRSTSKKFSKPDAVGTWTVVGDGTFGSVQLDSKGNFSGSVTDSTGPHPVAGTFYLAGSGSFKLFLTEGSLGNIRAKISTGRMNRSKDFIAMEPPASQADSTNSADSLTYLVLSNHPPKFSSLKSFKTATAGQAFTLPGSALLAASNAKDPDGDPLSFGVTAINNGTLQVNHVNAIPNFTVIHAGDEIEWTPSLTALGNTKAFSVKAFDGSDTSDTAMDVKIQVRNLPPTFTTVSTLTGATKNTAFTITYASLLAASNAVDPEGAAITFKITGVSSGSLKLNGVAVKPGDTLSAGDTLTWTPPANLTGALNAFIVAASDGVNLTASRQVTILVVL